MCRPLVAMDVRQRAGIQRIEAILIPHGPKHPYPWVGIRDLLDSLGVFLRERSTSDNKQWVGRIAARISENSSATWFSGSNRATMTWKRLNCRSSPNRSTLQPGRMGARRR